VPTTPSEIPVDHESGVYRLTFEWISAFRHPEVYLGPNDRVTPGLDLTTLPEEWWTETDTGPKEHDSAHEQWMGLQQMIGEGEPIRNVKLFKAAPIVWEQVAP
jgi:hypothetical protein